MLDNPEALARRRLVAELLHGKIVPDLVRSASKANSGRLKPMNNGSTFEFHQSDIAVLAKHLIEGDTQATEDLLSSYKEMGCSSVALILYLLSYAARELGQQWCDDVLSFADVTVGVSGLHRALSLLDRDLASELPRVEGARSIMLVCPKGDTHIFGISVIAAFFRNAGWTVETVMQAEEKEVLNAVSNTKFDVVGLSISRFEDVQQFKNLITRIRDRSIQPGLKILVGGSLILTKQELVAKLGADASADNALDALEIAASICNQELSRESV
ncbi:MAG: cobalamin-dependent protein [Pseudomonadota bacterium]